MTVRRVLSRHTEYERPWLAVIAKEVSGSPADEPYYSVRTHDYAAVLAITADGRVPLVRQFRPALERVSLELPSGLVEPGEDSEAAIRRELLEETGCSAALVEPLGSFDVDSGRLQTAQWAFFAPGVEVVGAPTGDEPDLEVVFVRRDDLSELVRTGEFRMAGHLAVLAAAAAKGLL